MEEDLENEYYRLTMSTATALIAESRTIFESKGLSFDESIAFGVVDNSIHTYYSTVGDNGVYLQYENQIVQMTPLFCLNNQVAQRVVTESLIGQKEGIRILYQGENGMSLQFKMPGMLI